MIKDSFLDTNIILSYSNYNQLSKDIVKRCYLYLTNKQGKFIVCGAVLEELQGIIRKRAIIHKIVLNKLENPDYSFEDNPLILKRDLPLAKQLYEKLKSLQTEQASVELANERDTSSLLIEFFLNNKVDERVIPIEHIQTKLVNKIYDIISNHSDCKIVASALQLQKDKNIFLFVTADGKDFSPNNYNFLKEQFGINYSKEKWKFPELHNLMFID